MAKTKGQFDNIADPALRKKLEETAAAHTKDTAPIPAEVTGIPRFAFCRSIDTRATGETVRVRNGLDEHTRGGRIVEKVGRAYRVEVGGEILIVHEPDDTWEQHGG